MHEAHVQRAIKEARRKLGIMVLPHELRHAYACDCRPAHRIGDAPASGRYDLGFRVLLARGQ